MSPKFQYQAKEGPHQVVEGIIEAIDHAQAINGLISKGLTPIEVKESIIHASGQVTGKHLSELSVPPNKIKRSDIVLFTRQMSDLLDASVPVFKALQFVARKTQNSEFRYIINQMGEGIRNGASFSAELSRYEYIFSLYYVNMVKAGEMAGKLETVLGRLAGSLEKEQEIMGKVWASLAYPLFVLGIGCMTVFILLSFVIPRFVVMFEDFGQSLPIPTAILMCISEWLAKFWWLVGLGFVFCWGGLREWRRSPNGRRCIDVYVVRLWIIGPFIQAVETGRFARILGTLIESGVTIVAALDIAKDTVSNVIFKEELGMVSSEVLHGMSLGNALKRVSFFPEMVVNMIFIGEETGHFEKGLYKIADVYEREAEHMMRTSVSLLGPLVLTGVIIIVGFIVIAIMLPIMQMNQLIR